MNELFEEVERLATLGFGTKPYSLSFRTPFTKDMQPFSPWKKEENTYTTTVRVVGVDPDDVEVELEDYGIHIKGKSETFGETYEQDVSIGIARAVMANIDEVNYEVKNGMCKIVLKVHEPSYKKVAISRK